MKLLLHACCGPCSLEPTRILREEGHDLTIFYANSNIAPAAEYEHRLQTLVDWAAGEGIPVIEGAYEPAAWEAGPGKIGQAALDEAMAAAGADAAGDADALPPCLSIDPGRRQARCRACYRLRFEETARVAVEGGFEGICSTLSVSPYQYTDIIHEELSRAAGQAGLAELFRDFRPNFPEATRRSRELGMYRQNYCGCRFSDAEAAAERAQRKAQRKAAREADRAAHAEERAAEEAAREARRAQRAEYDAKQARKHAILKALREQERKEAEAD